MSLAREQRDIMDRMVGQFDLQPPRRSTLHRPGETWAAVITADDARADVDAIGWMECPVGGVAAPESVEREPRPTDFVLAGRRARSKRIRSSAYGHKPRGDADASKKVKEEEDQERLPPPSTPPLWMRSPPPPPCCGQPTLAPLPPRSQHFGSPTEPRLSWGLPLLTVPSPPPPLLGLATPAAFAAALGLHQIAISSSAAAATTHHAPQHYWDCSAAANAAAATAAGGLLGQSGVLGSAIESRDC
ncbi:hypothetical protein ABZP36_019106 [Zizania latifolia]